MTMAALLTLLMTAAPQDQPAQEVSGNGLCGIHAVFVALLDCGIEPGTLAGLIRDIGPAGDSIGYSVGQLSQLLRTKGTHVLACKGDLASIEPALQSATAIAHTRRAHFVVLRKVGPDDVDYVDQAVVNTMSRKLFELQSTGIYILVSRDPIALPAAAWHRRHRTAIVVGVVVAIVAGIATVVVAIRRRCEAV